jgi:hypothetical protein
MTRPTTDPLGTSTCPRWCSGLHESTDNDGSILHESTCWELVVRDGGYPRNQTITLALGQSAKDAAAGKEPLITMYVPDDEQQHPAEFGPAGTFVGAEATLAR